MTRNLSIIEDLVLSFGVFEGFFGFVFFWGGPAIESDLELEVAFARGSGWVELVLEPIVGAAGKFCFLFTTIVYSIWRNEGKELNNWRGDDIQIDARNCFYHVVNTLALCLTRRTL